MGISSATYLAVLGLILLSQDARAFQPTVILDIISAALDLFQEGLSITHEMITEDSMLLLVESVLLDNPNPDPNVQSTEAINSLASLSEESLLRAYFGTRNRDRERLFEDAIEEIQDANSEVDLGSEAKFSPAHFDSEQILAGQQRLVGLRRMLISAIRDGSYSSARRLAGRMLHTLQDFYSHSNWIEMGMRTPYSVLGVPGLTPDNIAPVDMETCSDCEVEDEVPLLLRPALRIAFGDIAQYTYICDSNILPEINANRILTSGYVGRLTEDGENREFVKPCGKCSHGGVNDPTSDLRAVGGINKDSVSSFFASHPDLHDLAATVATQASVQLFQSIRSELDDDNRFAAFLNIELGIEEEIVTSIAIVIDKTLSVTVFSEIQTMLIEVESSLNEYTQQLGAGATVKFIIVSYDTAIEVNITNNIDEAIAVVAALESSSILSCTRPTNEALVAALQESVPLSDVYVFTDVPASDEIRFAEVQSLVIEKNIEVNIVIPALSSCVVEKRSIREERNIGLDLYQYLSTFSGGQLFKVQPDDINGLSQVVSANAQRSATTLLYEIGSAPLNNEEFNFAIDESVQSIVVIVNAPGLTVDVLTPGGVSITSLPPMDVTVHQMSSDVFIASVSVSNVGQWQLIMTTTGDFYSAMVIAFTDIGFRYRLFRPDTTALFGVSRIKAKPIAGEDLTFAIETEGDISSVTFSSASLLNIDRGTVQMFGLTSDSDGRDYVGTFQPATGTFQFRASGVDSSNNALSQIAPTGFQVSDLDLSLDPNEMDFYTLFEGEERNVTLVLKNLGESSSVRVTAEPSTERNTNFLYCLSAEDLSLQSNEQINIVLTIKAPEMFGEDSTSVILSVIATSTQNVLRNDFISIEIFASDVQQPVVDNIDYMECGSDTLSIPFVVTILAFCIGVVLGI